MVKKVRLLGVDTPEFFKSSCAEEKEASILAKNFIKEKIENKSGVLKTTKNETDKYGRWLAYF